MVEPAGTFLAMTVCAEARLAPAMTPNAAAATSGQAFHMLILCSETRTILIIMVQMPHGLAPSD
jgi:hypothetical protein